MKKKKITVDYSSREFATIKQDLVNHAKRYYPDSFQDFNEAGFGSLLLDTVAYVGDMLSFYLDYQANESFLETANEIDNVLKLAKSLGYKYDSASSSTGIVSFYILVPADVGGTGPDEFYLPVLKKGSTFSSNSGVQFILEQDVRFDKEDSEIAIGRVDENTGLPLYFAIKSYGTVVSGRYESTSISVGDYKRFRKIELPLSNIVEILNVTDSNGLEYYEVEHLSQDIIYRPISNKTSTKREVENFLRPYYVPRRFIIEKTFEKTYLQFGSGKETSDDLEIALVDPSSVALEYTTKNYVQKTTFEPDRLLQTSNFGIVPENTVLSVVARTNSSDNTNISANTLVNTSDVLLEFENERDLDPSIVSFIRQSLELTNEEPITGGQQELDTQNIKKLAISSFNSQGRAVTKEDYRSMIYRMPKRFGAVKRTNVIRDEKSYKRNINVYVISQDSFGRLQKCSQSLKENVKVWLGQNKMLNDTVDILDAKVINLSCRFSITVDSRFTKEQTLSRCISKLKSELTRTPEIGEPFSISDVYRILREVEGVLDVVTVTVENKSGGLYSNIIYDVPENTSPDGRYVDIPQNCIYEIKYINEDVKGVTV